jgi:hypothetical protein
MQQTELRQPEMVNQQQSFVAKIDLLNKIDGKYLKIDATEE